MGRFRKWADGSSSWRATAGEWRPLVADLLASHYDPAYRKSLTRNYRDAQSAPALPVRDITSAGFLALARQILREHA